MVVDVAFIIIFLIGFLIGSIGSWLIAGRYYRTSWLQSALKAKNPEIWDLAHFVLKEEEEQKKERTGTHRREKKT